MEIVRGYKLTNISYQSFKPAARLRPHCQELLHHQKVLTVSYNHYNCQDAIVAVVYAVSTDSCYIR